ncbi:Glycolipid transfer protein domain containing protein, partial [Parasponia andersonii]
MDGTPNKNHLRKLVDAFEELSGTVNSANPHIKTSQLAYACRQFATSNFNFGIPFIFADLELQAKADNVEKAAEIGDTIKALVERDVAQGCSKVNSSASRNINRLKRVIEFGRVIFEQILENEVSDSLSDPITIAYDQVFAPYHGSTIRAAVYVVKEFIPSKSSIFNLLNED